MIDCAVYMPIGFFVNTRTSLFLFVAQLTGHSYIHHVHCKWSCRP